MEQIKIRLQHILHKKPRELFPINVEKRKIYMYLITTFLNGSLEMNSNSSQRLTLVERKPVVHKFQEKKLQEGIRKIFFTVTVVKPWSRCPAGLWDSHLLKLFWTRA